MELNIKITTSDSCKVTIQDLSTYLPEDSTILAKHEFNYSDTLSIDVLQHNKSPQETVYVTHAFNKHTTKNSTTFFSLGLHSESFLFPPGICYLFSFAIFIYSINLFTLPAAIQFFICFTHSSHFIFCNSYFITVLLSSTFLLFLIKEFNLLYCR